MNIYAVQTKKGSEENVADMIINREMDEIHAALAPDDVVSYVMVEADNSSFVERAIEDIPNARKVIEDKKTTIAEIERFLEPTSDVEGINENDLVQITDGPFSGEKAKITNIDDAKERVTVEMIDSTVPIPVEIRGDQLRVLDSEERG